MELCHDQRPCEAKLERATLLTVIIDNVLIATGFLLALSKLDILNTPSETAA